MFTRRTQRVKRFIEDRMKRKFKNKNLNRNLKLQKNKYNVSVPFVAK